MAWSDAARRAALEARRRSALMTHKPSTLAKQRLAETSERLISRMTGAARTTGNAAMDNILSHKRRLYGIEVKTLIDNKNDKITMHPESLRRKTDWAKKNKAQLHTIIVDRRSKTRAIFHRQGVGSFRLKSLTPVKGGGHLLQLIRGE